MTHTLSETGLETGAESAVVPSPMSMSPIRALSTGFSIAAGAPETGMSRPIGGEARQGFRIGDLRFMIRYEEGSELAEMPVIHRLPNAPEWFCGIANLHGKLIPVFDLAGYVGIEPNLEAHRMLLVLSRGKEAAGMLIDGLPERLRKTDEPQTDAAAAPERLVAHLHGINLIGEQLWFDLDTRSLLGALEQSLDGMQ